jgi:hypothetical protein
MVAASLLIGGVAVVAASLAIGSIMTPKAPAEIEAFESLASFSAANPASQTFTFDEVPPGTSDSSLGSLGGVSIRHTVASLFKTEQAAFTPVSPPNVLAPFAESGVALGDTTLTFADGTHAVGFYLVLPRGSNQETIWSSTVEANTRGRSRRANVTFRGVVGEQQFIGFRSDDELVSISFGPAIKADASGVVAIDDIVVD